MSFQKMFWIFCLVIVSLSSYCRGELPSYIETCYRDDPGVGKCLKNTIEKLLPLFKSGSEDFGLEPLDPMMMDKLVYSYNSPLVGGNFKVTQVTLTGMSDMEVVKVRPLLENPEKFIIEFDAFLPKMNAKAHYTLKGNVIRIPVDMKGKVDVDFGGLSLKYRIEGDIKKINDSKYIVLKNFNWRFRGDGIKTLNLRNDDIVERRPALNRVVTTIVHTAWRPLKDYMLPSLLPEADKALKKLFTDFFQKYPYDVLFPKKEGQARLSDNVDKLDFIHNMNYDDPMISMTK